MTNTAAPVVRRDILVEAPIQRAFSVFIERFGDFKPPEHNLLGAAIAETVFEPHVGGHIYDRGVDGSVCRWARVLVYEPPARVVFSWDIGPTWQIRVPLGARAGLRAACPGGVQLGHRPDVADRGRPRQHQPGRGPLHRPDPAAHPGGVGAPQHRPARARLAGRARRGRRRRGMAAVPDPLRRAAPRGHLTPPITTSTDPTCPCPEKLSTCRNPIGVNP